MLEIFDEAFRGINLPLTIALLVIIAYWVVAIFGLVDFDSVDGFLGLDGDVDLDIDVEADAAEGGLDLDSSPEAAESTTHSPNAFQSVIKFMGANDAPVMFVLSLFTFTIWAGNLIGNYYFNQGDSSFRGNVILLISLVSAFFITKLTVRPLRPVMKFMRSAAKNDPVIGMSGNVRSKELTEDYGQVEVIHKGASILLNTRLTEGADPVPRGTEVLIVAVDEGKKLHIARPLGD